MAPVDLGCARSSSRTTARPRSWSLLKTVC